MIFEERACANSAFVPADCLEPLDLHCVYAVDALRMSGEEGRPAYLFARWALKNLSRAAANGGPISGSELDNIHDGIALAHDEAALMVSEIGKTALQALEAARRVLVGAQTRGPRHG